MGNTESSSQFPARAPPPSVPSSRGRRDETESESESSLEKALKMGAAVAGGALLAYGAYSLAAASSTSDDSDDQRRKAAYHQSPDNSTTLTRTTLEGFNYGTSRSARPPQYYHPSHLGDLDEHSFSGTIKILTYNIWQEEVEVKERMKAIGKLIEEQSPDIILLQEVTPKIYEIFQSSYWWSVYKSSVPEEKATKKNFCMLLIMSKLPVKKSTYIPFKSSSDGKGLCVSWIDTGENKLVVSTCHLKRPTDSEETNSTERVAQAKEAISILNSFVAPNIILGGDMNWNEDSDGPFPLAGKWKDAWSVLRPDEDGFTYDTKSNGMLKYSKPLKRRLDRFLCKMKDFKVVDIDVIGMDAIPQVLYKKKLPVYPSDHYGLMLTISLK